MNELNNEKYYNYAFVIQGIFFCSIFFRDKTFVEIVWQGPLFLLCDLLLFAGIPLLIGFLIDYKFGNILSKINTNKRKVIFYPILFLVIGLAIATLNHIIYRR